MVPLIRGAVLTGYVEVARSFGLDPYLALPIMVPHSGHISVEARRSKQQIWQSLREILMRY